jgi:DNA-binding FadR family transcriptional regulator
VVIDASGPATPGPVVRRVRATDRLAARWRARGLDRALADGARPDSSAPLALRAHVLIGKDMRNALATDLEVLIAMAWDATPRRWQWGPACRRRLREATPDLRRLAQALAAAAPVEARGVARTHLLLTEDGGLVYGLGGQSLQTLRDAIEVAIGSLQPA